MESFFSCPEIVQKKHSNMNTEKDFTLLKRKKLRQITNFEMSLEMMC